MVEFQVGETVQLALEVEGDTVSLGDLVVAQYKCTDGETIPPREENALGNFDVTYTAASGSDPQFFTLSIDAAATALMDTGEYVGDAILNIGSARVITGPVFFKLVRSVSEA